MNVEHHDKTTVRPHPVWEKPTCHLPQGRGEWDSSSQTCNYISNILGNRTFISNAVASFDIRSLAKYVLTVPSFPSRPALPYRALSSRADFFPKSQASSYTDGYEFFSAFSSEYTTLSVEHDPNYRRRTIGDFLFTEDPEDLSILMYLEMKKKHPEKVSDPRFEKFLRLYEMEANNSPYLKDDIDLTFEDCILEFQKLMTDFFSQDLSPYALNYHCDKCDGYHNSKHSHKFLRLRPAQLFSVAPRDFPLLDIERQMGFGLLSLFSPLAYSFITDSLLTSSLSLPTFIKHAKAISDWAKRFYYFLNFEGTHLYELASLGGYWTLEHAPEYNPTLKAKELMFDNPRSNHPLYPYFHKTWKDVTAQLLAKWKIKIPITTLTFRQFVEEAWLWATSGSSTYGHIFDNQGNKQKVSKTMVANIGSSDELYAMCMSTNSVVITPVTKQETGKIRVAYQVDLANYLFCAYVLHPLFFKDAQPIATPIGYNPFDMLGFGYDIMNSTGVKVPFDFEMFEKQPEYDELDFIIRGLAERVADVGISDAKIISNIFLQNLRNGYFHDPMHPDREVVKYLKGMVSGMYFTLDFDSFLNYTWHVTVSNIMGTFLQEIRSQGDDTLLFFTCVSDAIRHLRAMSFFFFENNIHKFWISSHRCEMLRLQYSSDRVMGYLNRSIVSIFQRKPLSSEEVTLESMLSNYEMCWNRALRLPVIRPSLIKLMKSEVKAAFGKTALNILELSGINAPLGWYFEANETKPYIDLAPKRLVTEVLVGTYPLRLVTPLQEARKRALLLKKDVLDVVKTHYISVPDLEGLKHVPKDWKVVNISKDGTIVHWTDKRIEKRNNTNFVNLSWWGLNTQIESAEARNTFIKTMSERERVISNIKNSLLIPYQRRRLFQNYDKADVRFSNVLFAPSNFSCPTRLTMEAYQSGVRTGFVADFLKKALGRETIMTFDSKVQEVDTYYKVMSQKFDKRFVFAWLFEGFSVPRKILSQHSSFPVVAAHELFIEHAANIVMYSSFSEDHYRRFERILFYVADLFERHSGIITSSLRSYLGVAYDLFYS